MSEKTFAPWRDLPRARSTFDGFARRRGVGHKAYGARTRAWSIEHREWRYVNRDTVIFLLPPCPKLAGELSAAS